MKKPWYTSKTVWLNVVGLLGAIVAVVEPMLGVLAPVIPAAHMPYIMVGFAVANVSLRFITKEAISV